MDDNFKTASNRENGETVSLPTFMEQVLDTVERVMEESTDRSS